MMLISSQHLPDLKDYKYKQQTETRRKNFVLCKNSFESFHSPSSADSLKQLQCCVMKS